MATDKTARGIRRTFVAMRWGGVRGSIALATVLSVALPGIGPLGIALAYGLAFGAMSIALGRVSGGHFNPAITIGFWATRRQGTFDALAFCAVQLAGAVMAAYLLRMGGPRRSLARGCAGHARPGQRPDAHARHADRGVAAFPADAGGLCAVRSTRASCGTRPSAWRLALVVTAGSIDRRPLYRRRDESGAGLWAGAGLAPLGQPGRLLGRPAGRRRLGGVAL